MNRPPFLNFFENSSDLVALLVPYLYLGSLSVCHILYWGKLKVLFPIELRSIVFACLFYYNSVLKSKLENIFLILCSVKIDSFSLGLIKNSFLKIYVSDPALIRRVLKVIQNPKCERMMRTITPCGSHWYSTQRM